jgi:hypothetical protein
MLETVERETAKRGKPIQLKKAGRWRQGFCPLHTDLNTPSFSIPSTNDRYVCFGCPPGRKSGDVISFIIRFNGWDRLDPKDAFKQACEYLGGQSVDIDTEELERQRKEHERIRAEQDAADAAALVERRKTFAARGAWKRYHANLSMPEARELWRTRGVPDNWQDYLVLGYTPDLWARQDEPGLGPALVIPYWSIKKELVTAQYRLQHVNGHGKYLFHPDLGNDAYIVRHDLPFDQLLITEGANKAIVAHIKGARGETQVIGMPSENHVGSAEIEERIVRAKEIWFWPDPGDNAYEWALDHIKRLGIQNKTKLIRFKAAKIDDALLGGLTTQGFKSQLATARLASLIINRRKSS